MDELISHEVKNFIPPGLGKEYGGELLRIWGAWVGISGSISWNMEESGIEYGKASVIIGLEYGGALMLEYRVAINIGKCGMESGE